MSGIGSRSAPTYSDVTAPANYVAGIGRGALGFTTRSDIGPARAAAAGEGTALGSSLDPQFGPAPAGYVAGRGRGMGDLARSQGEMQVQAGSAAGAGPAGAAAAGTGEDRGDYSESNYDEFSGYSGSLFANYGQYDDDDRAADEVYAAVDEAMELRRRRVREKQMLQEQQRLRQQEKNGQGTGSQLVSSSHGNSQARIADQFADLKQQLAHVTADEWESIPDVGDHSLKYKQSRRKETFMPLPDSVIANASALRGGEMVGAVDPSLDSSSGFASTINGTRSVVSGLAEVRGSELTSKLDKMSDSITGQTVVDPTGYLTSLNSMKISTAAEIGDIKKARALLQSVTTTNPRHGPGWIAAARVEELANKMVQARKVILQGCENCPDSEDVWIEAARLHPLDTAKAILANAATALSSSVKVWLKAADLETTDMRKKAILRRALEFVPNSVQLWKAAIELESVVDARIMLYRAVECVPQSVDMWLALAKLETHENARKVLNRAREAIPTERSTWVTAAKLEEAHGNGNLVNKIIEKMVVSLTQYQVIIKREEWIQEAIDAERCDALLTCRSVIKNTIHMGVDAEDRKSTWMDDAETCLTQQSPPAVETARAILNVALEVFPTKRSLWQQAAMMEKEFGTSQMLEDKLKDGVKHCPHAEILWLMAAKEKWLAGNVPDARAILLEAFKENPKSEQIWLAAVKLEWENNEFARARHLLARARERCPSERVWLKSALLERELQEFDSVILLLDEGIKLFPQFMKFYMMAGQTLDDKSDAMTLSTGKPCIEEKTKARNYFLQGLKVNPQCIHLWILMIRLEEKVKGVLRARPSCEQARMKNPQNELLWLEAVRLEKRSKNDKFAETLMAKALQECPKSGFLWSEILLSCPKTQQRSKAMEALKRCDQDPLATLAVARLFEKAGRVAKARKWYSRVTLMDPRLGDVWVYYWAFEYVAAFKHQLIIEGVMTNQESEQTKGNENNADQGAMDGVDDEEDEADAVHVSSDIKSSTSSDVSPSLVNADVVVVLKKIVEKCVSSQPNKGELWCSVSKETEMRRKDVATILLHIVERVLGFPLYAAVKDAMIAKT